ncbi:hypothetical protein TrVFT333_005318 [Trichoderma virens FT-333]|nr:hypothetical protein TrVFT333_005318 [Trichoderma virens FT-333]
MASLTVSSDPHVKPLPRPEMSEDPPRFIIIGAGARGIGYARGIDIASNGVVAAVADPDKYRRETLGKHHIWGDNGPSEGQMFLDWREFVEYEQKRRQRVANGESNVPKGVDGAFVCVQDQMHREVVVGLAPLGLHIMCEKPLAPSLDDCLDIYKSLKPLMNSKIFSIGHVLRYSPHNMMLRKLLVEDKVIGDINSVVHTEPVGWWHFTHSYVRGNWRNSATSGPSLLTKCCHDVDLILWLLCSPDKAGEGEPHLPDFVSSTGGLHANCEGVGTGNTDWPVTTVVHDIEDFKTIDDRKVAITKVLEDDWDESTPKDEVSSRNWFGRCVFEADNNVCDDQFVTITWPESVKPAKRVTIQMVAQTKKQCYRFSYFYGEHGEIYTDSEKIIVEDFATKKTTVYTPHMEHKGHGGGDLGLTRQFVLACDRVKNHGWEAEKAQNEFVGCTLEEVIRSHAMVFAAEEARVSNTVVNWSQFWDKATKE